ncbi:MAG TPA: hypothetical protein VFA25_02030 [Actinomycetota bacterium]|nr:hypothetical protein [Actinomycetota bacterium]
MNRRSRAIGLGLVVVVLYGAGAVLSSHLSPLARRPLLDGFVPPAPYNWVRPPPELASSNVTPLPGTLRLRIGPDGSRGGFFATGDAQVSLVLPVAAFASEPGAEAVRVEILPMDPSKLGPVSDDRVVTGNAYRIRATYEPSNDPATLRKTIGVVMVYPDLVTVINEHGLVISEEGTGWTPVTGSRDQHATRQVEGRIRTLGYIAVVARPLPPGSDGQGSQGIPLSVVFIVAGIVLLVVGVFLMAGGRRLRPSSPSPASDEDE